MNWPGGPEGPPAPHRFSGFSCSQSHCFSLDRMLEFISADLDAAHFPWILPAIPYPCWYSALGLNSQSMYVGNKHYITSVSRFLGGYSRFRKWVHIYLHPPSTDATEGSRVRKDTGSQTNPGKSKIQEIKQTLGNRISYKIDSATHAYIFLHI